MNWYHLANLDHLFEQAGEHDVLESLKKIQDMTTQTQRGARGMLIKIKENYDNDQELGRLFDKAIFYCPDSPKKVKIIINSIIESIASKILKKRQDEDNKDQRSLKGLVRAR